MKRIFCILVVISIILGVSPLSFGAAYQWTEINSVSFGDTYSGVETVGRSSGIQKDMAVLYDGMYTLKNNSKELASEDGIVVGGVLPNINEEQIGRSFKVSIKLYSGIVVNGRYLGKSKVRVGITDGQGKTFADVKEVDIRQWSDVEFTYTVNEDNLNCNKIIIDRGGEENTKDFPRWFSVASVKS